LVFRTGSVYCAVRTESLYKMGKFRPEGVKKEFILDQDDKYKPNQPFSNYRSWCTCSFYGYNGGGVISKPQSWSCKIEVYVKPCATAALAANNKTGRVYGSRQGRREPPSPPSKGGPTKNLYTKSERMNPSSRVTWAWSQRVNLYNRQIAILPKNTKTYATYSNPRPPSGPPSTRNLYRFPPSRRHGCRTRVHFNMHGAHHRRNLEGTRGECPPANIFST
jgi:hypothetical protein